MSDYIKTPKLSSSVLKDVRVNPSDLQMLFCLNYVIYYKKCHKSS